MYTFQFIHDLSARDSRGVPTKFTPTSKSRQAQKIYGCSNFDCFEYVADFVRQDDLLHCW